MKQDARSAARANRSCNLLYCRSRESHAYKDRASRGRPCKTRTKSMMNGTGTGIRTPVPWLRNAAGDLDGLRLRRFCWCFRTDLRGVLVLNRPFRAQSFKFFFKSWRTSLVTHADDLTGLHDPKGVENLRHERTQLLHTVRADHRYDNGNARASSVETGGSDRP